MLILGMIPAIVGLLSILVVTAPDWLGWTIIGALGFAVLTWGWWYPVNKE